MKHTWIPFSQSDVGFAICSSAGILTAVESFLTIKAGPDVSSFSQGNGTNVPCVCKIIVLIYVSLQLFTKWRKLFIYLITILHIAFYLHL